MDCTQTSCWRVLLGPCGCGHSNLLLLGVAGAVPQNTSDSSWQDPCRSRHCCIHQQPCSSWGCLRSAWLRKVMSCKPHCVEQSNEQRQKAPVWLGRHKRGRSADGHRSLAHLCWTDELGRSCGENDTEPLNTISDVCEHGLVLPVAGHAQKAQGWGANAAAGIKLLQTAPCCTLLLAAGTARLQTRATNLVLSSDYRDKRWALSLSCNTNVTLTLLPSAK